MKTKIECIEILAAELSALSADIDALREKADQAVELVQKTCAANVEVLRAKQFAAIEKMKKLDGYRAEVWNKSLRIKSEGLRTGLTVVAGKFK